MSVAGAGGETKGCRNCIHEFCCGISPKPVSGCTSYSKKSLLARLEPYWFPVWAILYIGGTVVLYHFNPVWALVWLHLPLAVSFLFLIVGVITLAIDLPRLWDEKDESMAKKGEANAWRYDLPLY